MQVSTGGKTDGLLVLPQPVVQLSQQAPISDSRERKLANLSQMCVALDDMHRNVSEGDAL